MKHDYDSDDEIAAVALGIAIKMERKIHGVSRQWVATYTGISRERLAQIERGRRKIRLTPREIERLSSALGGSLPQPAGDIIAEAERKVDRRIESRKNREGQTSLLARLPSDVLAMVGSDPIAPIPVLLQHAYGGTFETWNQWRSLALTQAKEQAIRSLKEMGM